ncbi:hypothetical protein CWI36_1331p0010 [Hamiltosporidium magnivora]|uniref:Uncharacterized protein n=1 Tax=Hamiltosporidium magnivora TaxID=148818 RepID=A0A4Q9L266_9MICR|nr:hypothetical protein CWI36_1331p0010 [Hamiltosporidium magnivora]
MLSKRLPPQPIIDNNTPFYCKQEKLLTSETKSLKKIMQELYLNLSSVSDLSETQVMKNEFLNVYEKKITINVHLSYSEIRFYRELSKYEVIRDKIVSFWSKMWYNNNETVHINDFLLAFVLYNHPTMFSSLDEFVNIINLLPN